MNWGHDDATDTEQRALPILSIDDAQQHFRSAPSNAPFLLYITAERGEFRWSRVWTAGDLPQSMPPLGVGGLAASLH